MEIVGLGENKLLKHYVLVKDGKYYRPDMKDQHDFFQDDNLNNADVFLIDERYLYEKLNLMRSHVGITAYFVEVEISLK